MGAGKGKTMAEPIRVEEAYTERDETINAQGAVTEIEIPYLVFGVSDESAALAAGTSNEVASVSLTASSAMVFGEGASFTCADLIIHEGSTLYLTGDLKATFALAMALRRSSSSHSAARRDASPHRSAAKMEYHLMVCELCNLVSIGIKPGVHASVAQNTLTLDDLLGS